MNTGVVSNQGARTPLEGSLSTTKGLRRRLQGTRQSPSVNCSTVRYKILQTLCGLMKKRCPTCYRGTCKCWAYYRSDGVCEGFLMEAVREPITSPGGGGSRTGGIFFSSSGPVRPPKSLSFSSPTGHSSPFSPTAGTSPVLPPSGGCYRRASSVSRPSPTGGGYRTAGVYRNRSGSVPPPSDNGKGTVTSSAVSGLPYHQPFGSCSIRRPCGGGPPDGSVIEGTISHVTSPIASLVERGAAQRGLMWAQLDLLQMECANGGGSSSQPCSENNSPSESCAITTEERLIKTNPIWFLADLHRVGAVHLLQGKEEGSFLVRQSSQSDTLAISVRLPPDKGPHVQHYLVEIQPQGQYCLEASDNRFSSLPALLAYYTECCEELPVRLKLPKCVQEAKTRHELASIALLGQEFWATSMASPSTTPSGCEEKSLPIKSPKSRPSDLSFSSFGKGGLNRCNLSNSGSSMTPLGSGHLTDTTSCLTPTRPAPPIPSAVDRSNLNLTPEETTEKDYNSSFSQFSSTRTHSHTSHTSQQQSKPTPPPRTSPSNTQEKFSKPMPPVRSSPSSSSEHVQSPSNITVTTTLTFNVSPKGFSLPLGSSSPSTPSSNEEIPREAIQLHVSSLEISPCTTGTANSCRERLKLHFRPPYSSPPSQPQTPLTPLSEDSGECRVRLRKPKSKRRDSRDLSRRTSNHYHETNVLLEPPLNRSSLADKISDYEDLWTSPPPSEITGGKSGFLNPPTETSRKPVMSSFKPRPDISKSMGDLCDVTRREREENYQNGARTSEESLEGRQANSPFYVEPLDALRRHQIDDAENQRDYAKDNRLRIRKACRKVPANRHSDSNIEMRSRRARNVLARIEDNLLEDNLSSSQEDIEEVKNNINSSKMNNNASHRLKPIIPPKVTAKGVNHKRLHGPSGVENSPLNWIDASWEFLSYIGGSTNDGETALIPGELTVQSLIKQRLPHLMLNNNLTNNPYHNLGLNFTSNLTKNLSRCSEYDNVAFGAKNESQFDSQVHRVDSDLSHYIQSSVSDSGTEFSEPWDSRKWDSLLRDGSPPSNQNGCSKFDSCNDSPSVNLNNLRRESRYSDSDSLVQVTGDSACDSNEESLSVAPTLSVSQKSNYDTNLRSKILSPQMLAMRHRKDAESGAAVRRYALSLGTDNSTTFSQAIRHFLTCTLESPEKEASVIVRNVRQFMSGMKNYLVTSGEGEFEAIVTRERSNLKSTEFLNLDAILEDVLVRMVLRPLWTHINQLYVDSLTNDGSIQKLADNIAYAKALHPSKLGIRAELLPPKGTSLEAIQLLLLKMQLVYAPREKLAHLLGMISHIYHVMYENGVPESATGDADDLVPMIMWVLIHCEVVSAEVEADYMQGLLLPSSAGGEASYYLNAFQSAIHSLKHLDQKDSPSHLPGQGSGFVSHITDSIADQGVLRIIVPDEKNGSIVTRTLPIRPGSTARELCRMMAHKLRVTNPQDFALYKLIDGHEWLLGDNECPQKIRKENLAKGSHCLIAFKRIDAKIAWPLNK